MDGYGRILYSNHQFHIGNYKNNKPQGKGRENYFDQKTNKFKTRDGYWLNQKFHKDDPLVPKKDIKKTIVAKVEEPKAEEEKEEVEQEPPKTVYEDTKSHANCQCIIF